MPRRPAAVGPWLFCAHLERAVVSSNFYGVAGPPLVVQRGGVRGASPLNRVREPGVATLHFVHLQNHSVEKEHAGIEHSRVFTFLVSQLSATSCDNQLWELHSCHGDG